MEQPAQTQPEQTTPQTPQMPAPPQATVSRQPYIPSPIERKRKLATRLAIVGFLCVTAPIWGIFLFMAGGYTVAGASGSGSDGNILSNAIMLIPIFAPIPGIGLVIASLVLRAQAKKLSHDAPSAVQLPSTPSIAASSPVPGRPATPPQRPSRATPEKLFLIGTVSFILMFVTEYISSKHPHNDIVSSLVDLFFWTSIGCVGFSLVKAFSSDKGPPPQ